MTEQQNRREGAGRKAGVTGVFSEASTKRVQRTERGSVVKKKKKKACKTDLHWAGQWTENQKKVQKSGSVG